MRIPPRRTNSAFNPTYLLVKMKKKKVFVFDEQKKKLNSKQHIKLYIYISRNAYRNIGNNEAL